MTNIENVVLPEDLKMAINLYNCCYSCLNRARLEFDCGQIDEAERFVTEFQRCKRDLDKLINKKKQHDRLLALTENLKKRGIDIAIVYQKLNEIIPPAATDGNKSKHYSQSL